MQYESNPANSFRDIVRKRDTDAQPDMVMTIPPPPPAPTSWVGDKHGDGIQHQHPTRALLLLFKAIDRGNRGGSKGVAGRVTPSPP